MDELNSTYQRLISEWNIGTFVPGIDNPKVKKKDCVSLDEILNDLILISESAKDIDLFKGSCILDESKHPEVNYGNRIIGWMEQKINWSDSDGMPVKLSLDVLKSMMSRRWIHYQELTKYSDERLVFVISWRDTEFGAKMLLDILGFKDLTKKNIAIIEKKIGTSFGFFYANDNILLLGFDFEKHTSITINHELSHLFQEILGINLFVEQNEHSQDILTDEEKKYAFNEREFWTVIYNDLYQALSKIYWSSFKKDYDYTWHSFIAAEVEHMKGDLLETQDIYVRWMDVIKTDPLMLKILAVMQLENPKLFSEVVKKLKEK